MVPHLLVHILTLANMSNAAAEKARSVTAICRSSAPESFHD